MFRFFQHLISKGSYESCKACEVYKNQLDIVNAEKAEMLQTILNLVRPIVAEVNPRTTDVAPITPQIGSWSRTKARIEENTRSIARQRDKSAHLAKPDDLIEKERDSLRDQLNKNVEELERQLGMPGSEPAKEEANG